MSLTELVRYLIVRCELLQRRYGRDAVLKLRLEDAGATKLIDWATGPYETWDIGSCTLDLVEVPTGKALKVLRGLAA